MPRRFLFSPWKSGVAESNGNVRIFYGKLQRSSLCTCSVQNWPKQPRTNGTTLHGLRLQCICNGHIFELYPVELVIACSAVLYTHCCEICQLCFIVRL